MTLRAEDFTVNGLVMGGNLNEAEAFVEQLNKGVKERNYGLYQEGFQALIQNMEANLPQLQKPMNRKLFLLDTVARFMEEIQIQEPGYREFPFETNIGIGELFLNPSLEVRIRDTNDLIAVFDSVRGYRLVTDRSKLEKVQDGFIKGQKQRSYLQNWLKRAEALLENPILVFEPEYDDFLCVEVEDKGIIKALKAYAVRRNHAEFYATDTGEQGLREEMEMKREELGTVQETLDSYVDDVKSLNEQAKDVEKYKEAFSRLMKQYQVPEAKAFN